MILHETHGASRKKREKNVKHKNTRLGNDKTMGLFELFRPRNDILKEKIIYTQKTRITSLEQDIQELKGMILRREGELKEVRTNFERGKDRLIDQIIDLSDKFADINDTVAKMAHENGRLKVLVEHRKPLLDHKGSKKK